jgi:hypothetical protein
VKEVLERRMQPFRFGVLIERFPSPSHVLETARAEAAGYVTLVL